MISNDAQADQRLETRVDKATAFRTRSVLCVVLREGGATDGAVRAVVQLINKKTTAAAADGAATSDAPAAAPPLRTNNRVSSMTDPAAFEGLFEAPDAEAVRSSVGEEILAIVGTMSLQALRGSALSREEA